MTGRLAMALVDAPAVAGRSRRPRRGPAAATRRRRGLRTLSSTSRSAARSANSSIRPGAAYSANRLDAATRSSRRPRVAAWLTSRIVRSCSPSISAARLASRSPPGVKASPDAVRVNSWSPNSLRNWAMCSDTADSETSSSAAACLTDPSRTTATYARSCVGVIGVTHLPRDRVARLSVETNPDHAPVTCPTAISDSPDRRARRRRSGARRGAGPSLRSGWPPRRWGERTRPEPAEAARAPKQLVHASVRAYRRQAPSGAQATATSALNGETWVRIPPPPWVVSTSGPGHLGPQGPVAVAASISGGALTPHARCDGHGYFFGEGPARAPRFEPAKTVSTFDLGRAA